jgi:hypothetical protein
MWRRVRRYVRAERAEAEGLGEDFSLGPEVDFGSEDEDDFGSEAEEGFREEEGEGERRRPNTARLDSSIGWKRRRARREP